MQRSASHVVRGATAGAAGAVTLALFFLVVDAARGAALQTPAFLAASLFGRADVSTALIAVYTIIHVLAFIAVGIGAAVLTARLRLAPHFLFGVALGLLLFAVLFYAGVAITGVDVVRALGWPEVLVGNLLAGVAVFGALQLTAAAGTPSWRDSLRPGRVAREGVIAGAAGATMVASWFLVLDAISGRPFFTPAALASALLFAAPGADAVTVSTGVLVLFTLLHYAAFIAVGVLAAAFVARAERNEYVMLGGVLLFVTMEAFVIGLLAIAGTWLLTEISWWSIAAANVLAALVMGVYLWREHPGLHGVLSRRSLEEPELTTPRPAAAQR